MRKITRQAWTLCLGVLALGFASCSDDDNDDKLPDGMVAISANEISSAIDDYVDNVINPTYSDLRAAAVELDNACSNLYAAKKNGSVSQTDIDAACTAFKKARRFWEQSESFLYGAATNDHIDPHMDSWPLDQSQLAEALTSDAVIAGITGNNPGQYVYSSNSNFDSTMGFHGLEFVLFRNGANRTAAAFNNEMEDGEGLNLRGGDQTENERLLKTVSTLHEAAFAAAVAKDLRNMTSLLEYEWNGSNSLQTYLNSNAKWVIDGTRNNGKAFNLLNPEKDDDANSSNVGTMFTGTYNDVVKSISANNTTLFKTWNENLQNVFVGGCSNISQEVYTQKLGQAYRVASNSSNGEDAGDYIESPYSQRSFQDYQDNIYSIRNSLYGRRGIADNENITPASGSIMSLMQKYYPEYNDLNAKLNAAINALETAKKGTPFIKNPASDNVKACIDAVHALDDALNAAGTWCSRNIAIRN